MSRPPNVLILWTDQQRADALGFLNPAIATPNFDRLADCSTVFTTAICSQPVCTPSRAALMSGLWPHQHGNWLNNSILPTEVRCIPEYLREHRDYDTGHIGKWHLGLELFPQHGFDQWEGSEDDYQQWFPEGYDRSIRSPYHHFLVDAGYTPDEWGWFNRFVSCQLPERHSKPAWIADRAVDFIHTHGDKRPWILDVNCLEPHHPNSSCRNSQYDPAQVPLPEGALEAPPPDATATVRHRHEVMKTRGIDGKTYPDEAARRQAVANYYGLVSLVDQHYGRLLEALEASGQFDNTLIIFTSDHGEMLNQFGLWGKGVMYDAAIRVPLMIKLPGQRQARRYEAPVGQIDLLPTLLDFHGINQPDELSGRSLLPACRGEHLPAQDAFCVWEASGDAPILDPSIGREDRRLAAAAWHADNRPWKANKESVRTVIAADGWRYSSASTGEIELFDRQADPAERQNLATDPKHSERRRAMHRRLEAWQQRTGDFVRLPPAS